MNKQLKSLATAHITWKSSKFACYPQTTDVQLQYYRLQDVKLYNKEPRYHGSSNKMCRSKCFVALFYYDTLKCFSCRKFMCFRSSLHFFLTIYNKQQTFYRLQDNETCPCPWKLEEKHEEKKVGSLWFWCVLDLALRWLSLPCVHINSQ